jgi:hypothetical protein
MTGAAWDPGWQGFSGTPYIDWENTVCRGERQTPEGVVDLRASGAKLVELKQRMLDPRRSMSELDRFNMELATEMLERVFDTAPTIPNFPTEAITGGRNADGSANLSLHTAHILEHGALPDALRSAVLPDALKLDNDTPIIGLLDLGIPLGHRRTCTAAGKTRILASWQQSAAREDLNAAGQQLYLPFGREVLAPEIDDLIAMHTRADGSLDEEAFNRACGTEDYARRHGHRELGGRSSHGAPVLDLAAGADPAVDPEIAASRIIAVNFPQRPILGHWAQYLDFFALLGILRIVTLADAIWIRNNSGATLSPPASGAAVTGGYPIAINLSFGKQAGPRDGSDLMSEFLSRLNEKRRTYGLRPVFLVLPAGNENLERGNVQDDLRPGAIQQIDLRLQPDDRSPNFVEIYCDGLKAADMKSGTPVELELDPPGPLPKSGFSTAAGGHSRTLRTGNMVLSRLYVKQQSGPGAGQIRVCFVVAIGPTQVLDARSDLGCPVPAGIWRLRVRNKARRSIKVTMSIQTDQSGAPGSSFNKRSYFDDEDGQSYNQMGGVVDSYAYDPQGQAPVNTDQSNLLRRHGTLNAVGPQDHILLIAGHRESDGRMEPYSATGGELPWSQDGKMAKPAVSMPSRETATHFGKLATGSRDGSCVAMQGTSFAAALATRRLIRILAANGQKTGAQQVRQLLKAEAEADERAQSYSGKVSDLKAGWGRMKANPGSGELGRFRRLS